MAFTQIEDKNHPFRIKSNFIDPVSDGYLYWSDDDGWVDRDSAHIYTNPNITMPMEAMGIEYVTSD